jgi:hypothetical protein
MEKNGLAQKKNPMEHVYMYEPPSRRDSLIALRCIEEQGISESGNSSIPE